MLYRHNYSLKIHDDGQYSIVINDIERIRIKEFQHLTNTIFSINLINKESKHLYFWMKDRHGNLCLFSYKDPFDFFMEYCRFHIEEEKQAYEFTLFNGIEYISDNVGSMEKFANDYCDQYFKGERNVLIYKNQDKEKYGYIIFGYFNNDRNNIKQVSDERFLMIVSEKRYEFKGFNRING